MLVSYGSEATDLWEIDLYLLHFFFFKKENKKFINNNKNP